MKNKLLAQIAKFGLVGVICFVIDYLIYLLLNAVFEKTGMAAALPSYIYVPYRLWPIICCPCAMSLRAERISAGAVSLPCFLF